MCETCAGVMYAAAHLNLRWCWVEGGSLLFITGLDGVQKSVAEYSSRLGGIGRLVGVGRRWMVDGIFSSVLDTEGMKPMLCGTGMRMRGTGINPV